LPASSTRGCTSCTSRHRPRSTRSPGLGPRASTSPSRPARITSRSRRRKSATAFKCAPPIRASVDREALWAGLASGAIDLVATDHSPAPADLKHLDDGDFWKAWGGIASLQLALPAVWTGARSRGLTPDRLAAWLSAAPARLAGLSGSKGRIAVGQDADLLIWDPGDTFRVEAGALLHRHAVTPYDGRQLYGRVLTTILRGRVVSGEVTIVDEPSGQLLGGSVG
jgi:allantoinase